tara:strand:- start:266 stop:448 length:183 start_codon:yes stop_codon:yes gene_type:complete
MENNMEKTIQPVDFIVTIILMRIKKMLEKRTDLIIKCDELEDAYLNKLDELSMIQLGEKN